MDGENVTDLAVTIDSRENTQSYEISLFKMADLQAGDEVNITYTPMGVNVDTRIISIEYDPFYRYTVRVEVGDYVPNLLASTATQLDRVRQEFKAADGKLLSSIQTVDGNLSTLSQTVSGFNTRIENAEGAVSTLSQTVSGFNTRIENAEGSVSTLTQTVNSFKTRIETAEGNITSVTQTANKINWLVKSGTSASDFTMTDRAVKLVADTIDLSGYVTISALGTAGKDHHQRREYHHRHDPCRPHRHLHAEGKDHLLSVRQGQLEGIYRHHHVHRRRWNMELRLHLHFRRNADQTRKLGWCWYPRTGH